MFPPLTKKLQIETFCVLGKILYLSPKIFYRLAKCTQAINLSQIMQHYMSNEKVVDDLVIKLLTVNTNKNCSQ